MKGRILVVEDEMITAEDIRTTLIDVDFEVVGVVDRGEDAIKAAKQFQPDLILMDIHLKGEMTGIEAAEFIFTNYHIPIIFLTAYADRPTVDKAGSAEPYGYIIKPFNHDEIFNLEFAIQKHRENAQLMEHEENYMALMEYSAVAMAIIHKGFISFINVEFANFFGKKPSELMNHMLQSVLLASRAKEFKGLIENLEQHKPIRHLRISLQNMVPKEGAPAEEVKKTVWLEINTKDCIIDGKLSMLVMATDITERVEYEVNLKKRIQNLKEQMILPGEKDGAENKEAHSSESLVNDNDNLRLQLKEFLELIGSPDRLRILESLKHGERSLVDLEYMLEKKSASLYHHTRKLEKAGLLKQRKQGKTVFYSISQEKMKNFRKVWALWLTSINNWYAKFEEL